MARRRRTATARPVPELTLERALWLAAGMEEPRRAGGGMPFADLDEARAAWAGHRGYVESSWPAPHFAGLVLDDGLTPEHACEVLAEVEADRDNLEASADV